MIATLVARAGYGPEEPVLVAVRRARQPAEFVVQGSAVRGVRLTATARVYAASLSKQFTAACAALLVQAGRLDIDMPAASLLPELPAWASTVRLRQLVHHTAGLPDDVDIGTGPDRTTAAVIAALSRIGSLPSAPGTEFRYSNAGYVCLALAVERAADRPLPDLARQYLFDPLRMRDTLFWPGPGPMPRGSIPLASIHPAPLSLGDGGAWSTAADLLLWNQAMNADTLGVSALLQTPGSLDDGRPLDYAWGIGVRAHAGHRAYRHGGGWPGLRLLLARVPDLGIGLVVVAPADDTERHVALADALLTTLTGADDEDRRSGRR